VNKNKVHTQTKKRKIWNLHKITKILAVTPPANTRAIQICKEQLTNRYVVVRSEVSTVVGLGFSVLECNRMPLQLSEGTTISQNTQPATVLSHPRRIES